MLIVLAELVNTYQNTGEMIKFFFVVQQTGLDSREDRWRYKSAPRLRILRQNSGKKLADLSRVSKLLTAVILSCL